MVQLNFENSAFIRAYDVIKIFFLVKNTETECILSFVQANIIKTRLIYVKR